MSYIKKFDDTTGKPEKNKIIGGVLYLVATPIGNLADISERAVKTLNEVDFIAAEDTRNSGNLLAYLGIEKKPMISYFEHNKRERGEVILNRLLEGQSGALITDAGTPAISDPGEDIVRLCAENGVTVTSVPGCCAAINALIMSGLNTSRFVFEGFLSTAKNERRERLIELEGEVRTVILYEAPHKLKQTLEDLHTYLGNRKIALCREMTKLNEEVMRTTIKGAIEYYSQNQTRGEYVLIIEGCSKKKHADDDIFASMTVEEQVRYYIENHEMSKMDAIKATAKQRGVGKSEIYKQVNK